ncbi:MAG: 3-phosphoshikimate 1-carboxyvinyltransferase [Candidatus Lokiarchaeota archaeon]|nr:3-phosphoshikimate 1-carboxyvinyltransferase [Candidatus Lokiarchaeota archaeon]
MKLRITYTKKLIGTIDAPPSKSYSHRAFIASSLAKGVSIIKNPLISGDVGVTIKILEVLGHKVSKASNHSFIVRSNYGNYKPVKKMLDCKNSGTSIRIFSALAMVINGGLSFTGEFIKRKRPIIPLLKALESIGCNYKLTEKDLIVRRKGKTCDIISIPGDISSQFVSALLMMCPLLACKKKNSMIVKITSPINSYPYVKITLDVLRSFGIKIQENLNNERVGSYIIACKQNYRAQTYEIPGDFSSISFILAAVILTPEESQVTIKNLDFEKPQGDQKIIEILQEMGANIKIDKENNCLIVRGNINQNPLTGIAIDIRDTPDLFPILSIIGAFAKGKTEIYNALNLRIKESDRISIIAKELRKMGVKVIEEEDKITIYHCEEIRGASFNHENDHRIAMALTIAGLFAQDPSQIEDIEIVEDSYPNFIDHIKNLGANVDLVE